MNSGETGRLWRLQTSANSLVLEGKKDAGPLLDFLQVFVFGPGLANIDWPGTYKTFGMEDEYKEAMKKLPAWQDAGLWIVPVIGIGKKCVGCNMVVTAMRKRFKVWPYYDDLEANIVRNDRSPANGSYLVGFRRTIEADEENRDLSANKLAERQHIGTTCLERLILGYGYHLTTGQHLDVKCATLCPGSRYSDGDVPGVYYNPDSDEVCVGRYGPGSHSDVGLRSRAAVPPPRLSWA